MPSGGAVELPSAPAPPNAPSSEPPAPQFRCPEHPRRQLGLLCRACNTIVCVACTEGEHRPCRQRWASKHVDEAADDAVFESLNKTIRRIRDELKGKREGLGTQGQTVLQQLSQRASRSISAPLETQRQMQRVVKAVHRSKRLLLKALAGPCDMLVEAMEEAAAGRLEGLKMLLEDMTGRAAAMQLLRGGQVVERLDALGDVEQRPVEVAEACVSVMAQLKSHAVATSQAKQLLLVAQAELGIDLLQGLYDIEQQLRSGSWHAGMEPDPVKCVVSIDKPTPGCTRVVAGDVVELRLQVGNKDGEPRAVLPSDVGVRARATVVRVPGQPGKRWPSVLVDDDGRVTSVTSVDGGRTFVITCTIREFDAPPENARVTLQVLVMGHEVHGSPVSLQVGVSRILDAGNHDALVRLLEGGGSKKRLRLCYRASRDGWGAADFHRCCDNKGATVVVAQESTHGYIFGGYTSVPWSSPAAPQYTSDLSAFLFSPVGPRGTTPMKTRFNCPPRMINAEGQALQPHSVLHARDHCAVFGEGPDMHIVGDADRKDSCCNLGHTYSMPGQGSSETCLTGAVSFTLTEFEVYVVTTEPAVDGQGPASSVREASRRLGTKDEEQQQKQKQHFQRHMPLRPVPLQHQAALAPPVPLHLQLLQQQQQPSLGWGSLQHWPQEPPLLLRPPPMQYQPLLAPPLPQYVPQLQQQPPRVQQEPPLPWGLPPDWRQR